MSVASLHASLDAAIKAMCPDNWPLHRCAVVLVEDYKSAGVIALEFDAPAPLRYPLGWPKQVGVVFARTHARLSAQVLLSEMRDGAVHLLHRDDPIESHAKVGGEELTLTLN